MPKKLRKFKKPTKERLENAALYYLGRYAASEASLRRVLENKIRRASMQNPTFAADHEAITALHEVIDQIVAKHKKLGIIDDKAFAEMKVSSLRRAGKSRRRITQQLMQKGIAADLIEEALIPEEESEEDIELRAAHAFARKRRFGPYRKGSADDKEKGAKEIASMARAGFSFDIAKKVLETDIEIIEDFSA